MRPHWENCLTHFDEGVEEFVIDYFSGEDRRCLVVGGAGFDPRARHVSKLLVEAMGDRLHAFMVREERGNPAANLQQSADENETYLRGLIADTTVERVPIFADDDNAPVGGARVAGALNRYSMPQGLTDIVLDMSAISIGIGFPAARLLLAYSEQQPELNFHLIMASNPDLDGMISSEPDDRVINVRGYSGLSALRSDKPVARIWLPQLARGRSGSLDRIRSAIDGIYRTCPMLPFPAINPRRADELITEFGGQLRDDWEVDARDLIYVSERNPLDSYRTISTLKLRYDKTVEGIYQPEMILSPVGSKVMAVGAMMAAIEHNLPVQYVETVRYDFGSDAPAGPPKKDRLVHLWLDGPVYNGLSDAKTG